MFSRAAALFLLALFSLPLLAVATPWGAPKPSTTTATATTTVTVTAPAPTVTAVNQCNTGPIQCCNTVETANSSGVGLILGLLGIVLNDLTVLVGLTCSPLSVVGVGSGCNANAQPVCCQNNSFNGIIAIGCTPININL